MLRWKSKQQDRSHIGKETISETLADSKYHYIPEDGPFENYINHIKEFPQLDIAELFGQHDNAEIPYRIQESESLLKYLQKCWGDTYKFKKESSEKQIIKFIEEIKQEIPSKIYDEESENVEKFDPYSYVLIQERKRYNILLDYIEKSLDILKDNVTGKQKMTERVEHMVQCIQQMEVPPEWLFAYPSLKPLGSWVNDLKDRIKQFQEWSSTNNPPVKFWLPGFISPKSLLNAALLTAVKNSDVTIKDLEWEYYVSTLDEVHIKEAPLDGIFIQGLFLEGAGWDKTNSLLTEPEPLDLFVPMPVIHFKPVIESTMRGIYTCPCYYISKRKNKSESYLFDIELKTKKPKEHWIKRGTALILSNNE